MASDRKIVILSVALIAIILIGEVVVYSSGTHNYSADSQFGAGEVDYTVGSAGTKVFDVVVTDNGSYKPITELYVYYDEAYKPNYEKVVVAVGARALDQEYYVQQLVNSLKYRGFEAVTIVDSAELASKLASDTAGGSFSKGLVVISGALPDTVYTGNATDPILNWIGNGGSLYWLGNVLGAAYATREAVVPVTSDYQTMFLGVQCLNTVTDKKDPAYTDIALSDWKGNDYRNTLALMNNRVKYAVDVDKLAAKTSDFTAAGYAEKAYASTVFVKSGQGMVCILGGDYSNNQRNDLAQIIAAGLCYCSNELSHIQGTVSRGTVDGKVQFAMPAAGNMVSYIYLGGYFSVYGHADHHRIP